MLTYLNAEILIFSLSLWENSEAILVGPISKKTPTVRGFPKTSGGWPSPRIPLLSPQTSISCLEGQQGPSA